MITYSGVHIQTIGGADGTPTPADIAVQSGRICRFGGAVWYPLLPHLVFVGMLAWRRSGKLSNLAWGFLHDAHEVVTNDIPRPFKCDCTRKEQQAIDERILSEWFTPDLRAGIDFDLIHQCDLDACDIEAVTLGLRGYRTVTTAACTKGDGDYKHKLHDDPKDIRLFHRIRASAFFTHTIQASGYGVLMFELALTLLKQGRLRRFEEEVTSWHLFE